MGRCYTNVTLRGPSQGEVAACLDQRPRWAIVSPTRERLTVVYDSQSERLDETIFSLAKMLSARFECPALAVVNRDDKVLYYRLFSSGTLLDTYESSPHYLEGAAVAPSGGDAQRLCAAFGREVETPLVREILRFDRQARLEAGSGDCRYRGERERHGHLVETLRLSWWAVGYGYDVLADGEWPPDLAIDECAIVEGEHEGP